MIALIIGVSMIFALFAGIFYLEVKYYGLKASLILLGMVAASLGFIALAIYLIQLGVESL